MKFMYFTKPKKKMYVVLKCRYILHPLKCMYDLTETITLLEIYPRKKQVLIDDTL